MCECVCACVFGMCVHCVCICVCVYICVGAEVDIESLSWVFSILFVYYLFWGMRSFAELDCFVMSASSFWFPCFCWIFARFLCYFWLVITFMNLLWLPWGSYSTTNCGTLTPLMPNTFYHNYLTKRIFQCNWTSILHWIVSFWGQVSKLHLKESEPNCYWNLIYEWKKMEECLDSLAHKIAMMK